MNPFDADMTATETAAGDGAPMGDDAPPPTSGDSSESGAMVDETDAGIVFDLGVMPDLETRRPIVPSCDDLAMLGPTSVGCEFWASRVPVYNSSPFQPPGSFGVGVGNPFDHPVVVTFEDLRGPGGTLRQITQVMLAPHQSQLVALNGPGSLLPNESHEVAAEGLSPEAAFRITSDEPITAMQINPLGGAPSYVPEASMLLPTNALGEVYYGLGYASYPTPFPLPGLTGGFVIVVAIEDATTITTAAGDQMLDAFDAWAYAPDDPTGFFVSADRPIAVFSGTACSNVPTSTGWCDHIEEQLIPVAAWGTHYVGARHPHRIPEVNPTAEPVYWRVVAATDDTVVTFTPPVAGGTIALASAGDSMVFNAAVSFVAESDDDHPFMLVQYMSGGQAVFNAEACGGGNDPATGDPYMLQMVPTAQWLEQLPFLTDGSYARDFVTIARRTGSQVTLQCSGVVTDDQFTPIVGTDYEVANVYLDLDGNGGVGNCHDGQQFIEASEPVGIAVGGFDCAASYGYPGGLSLDPLWVPPHAPPG